MKRALWTIFALVAIDIFTKYLILRAAAVDVPMYGYFRGQLPTFAHLASISSFFDIVLVWNVGVSFSMFSSGSQAGRWILVALSLIAVAFIMRMIMREGDGRARFGWILVASGAIGNILDRVRYGAVVDFLDFHIRGWHWPAFNFADVCICLGVLLLILKKK
ncbi:MAG: signal peptidase II [Rickettsiales bacterium]|jgi:signal peptidase II|nr:signal peptidase II [Rickettsiales bacterium]